MDTSRGRFLEALAVVRKGLSGTRLEHSGKYFQIPPVWIRPQPRNADLVDNMYMAWGSPASVAIAAENDLRPLVVPQKRWQVHVDEMIEYNRIRAEVGFGPASPVVLLGVYVHEDPEVAERVGRHHMEQWTDSALRHYQLANPEHLKDVKGYEYYNELAAKVTAEGTLGSGRPTSSARSAVTAPTWASSAATSPIRTCGDARCRVRGDPGADAGHRMRRISWACSSAATCRSTSPARA